MKVALIGAHLGVGAQLHDTAQGPEALKVLGLEQKLRDQGVEVIWVADIHEQEHTPDNNALCVQAFNMQLSACLQTQAQGEHLPVVLGGDHAIAMGTWHGIIQAYQAQQQFGLVWIDAHMDAHTPQTSPSKALHGMPVAGLLGHGEQAWGPLLQAGALIAPEHIVLLGIRSYEPEEAAFLSSMGVQYYDMAYIREHGFAQAFERAWRQVNTGTQAVGVTIDLDAFDPKVAPGVGSPEAQGLLAEEVLPVLSRLRGEAKLKAIEIAEYNPTLDKESKTANLVEEMIAQVAG